MSFYDDNVSILKLMSISLKNAWQSLSKSFAILFMTMVPYCK